jgi:clan AA aspartic protease (TIGR02281 family)
MKHDFLLDKRKIIVVALIKGIMSERNFRFILDTGASKTIIDETVASRLGFDLKKLEIGERLRTISGGINSKKIKLPKLSLFGKDVVNFEVGVVNFSPQMMYFADGLIGMDFLVLFKSVKFDFNEKRVDAE